MKTSRFVLLFALSLAWWAGGCGHIETSPGGDVNRVLAGEVNYRGDLTLPPDAEVVVRLIDPSGASLAPSVAARDLPVADRARVTPVPAVLAEQTIKPSGPGPVPFRLEFIAEDGLLRRGLNLEARVSYGGGVRLRTVTTRAVTLTSVSDPQRVWVEAVAR